jgi:hypothetical protein
VYRHIGVSPLVLCCYSAREFRISLLLLLLCDSWYFLFLALSLTSPTPDFAPAGIMEGEEPIHDHTHLLDEEGGERGGLGKEEELIDGGGGVSDEEQSTASDDSFHSTVEMLEMSPGNSHLYESARELVARGGVQCRKMRYVTTPHSEGWITSSCYLGQRRCIAMTTRTS